MAIILTYVFGNNQYMLEQLPWDANDPLKDNMGPYIVIFLSFIMPYLAINTLFVTQDNSTKSSHTKKTVGKIIDIEYSSIRVGNSPRFKVSVKYSGIENSFDALDERVQFHLRIGDNVVVYHDENDKMDAHINLDESIDFNKDENSMSSN